MKYVIFNAVNKVFKRKIEDYLLKWKKSSTRLPLIIEGARQIGKTFSILEFGKNEYKKLIYINFITNPEYKKIFSGSLDVNNLLALITLYATCDELIENDTLIFLDEIQECPNAVVALKSFATDKRYDIICSGSLISMVQSNFSSYPIGYCEVFEMHGMDFEEFLDAMGKKIVIKSMLLNIFKNKENIDIALGDKISDLFKTFLLTGGFPKAVLTYIETRDFNKLEKVKSEIIDGYIKDISSYGDIFEKAKASELLFSIPMQLLKSNKKFQFSKIKKHARLRDYEASLNWLTKSSVIYPVKKIESLEFDYMPIISDNNFKLYLRDTGLLLNLYKNKDMWKRIIEGKYFEDNGSIIENYILDCLLKQDFNPFFFKKESGLAIEFIILSGDLLIPISMKKHINFDQSIDILLKEQYKNISFGFRISENTFQFEKNIYTIPIYSLFLLKEYLNILDPDILCKKISLKKKDEDIKDDKDMLCWFRCFN